MKQKKSKTEVAETTLLKSKMKELITVTLDQITGDNYRKEVDDKELKSLAKSIAENGILQPPGVFMIHPITDDAQALYKVIYGNRRIQAAKLNGLEKIQVYCYNDVTEQEVEELALIENFQRSEPSAVDTYHAIVSLIKKGKSVKEISLSLGMTKIHAQRMYLISQMPPKLIDYFLKGSISFETAAVLASYTSDKHKELLQYLDEAPDKNQIYQLDDFEDLFEKVYLGNVSFDLKDPELIPEMGACTKCMFGSIANEILKEVEGTSNICTNKPCADKKDEISALRSISANPLQVLTLCVEEDEYIGDKKQRIVSKLLENGYSKVVYQSDEPYVFLNDDGSVIEDNAEDNGLADALESDTNYSSWNQTDEMEATIIKECTSFMKKLSKLIMSKKAPVYLSLQNFHGSDIRYQYYVPIGNLKIYQELVDNLGLKRNESIQDSESELPVWENGESGVQLSENYTEPIAAGKIINKIQRNESLKEEKMAEWMKREAWKTFTGPYSFATDPTNADQLSPTALERRTLVEIMYGQLSNELKNELQKAAGKKAKEKTNKSIVDKAIKEPAFADLILRAYLYQNLFMGQYRISPEDESFQMLEEIPIDGAAIREKWNAISQQYDHKTEKQKQKLELLKVPSSKEEVVEQ